MALLALGVLSSNFIGWYCQRFLGRVREISNDARKKGEPVFYWLTSLDNVQTAAELYKKR